MTRKRGVVSRVPVATFCALTTAVGGLYSACSRDPGSRNEAKPVSTESATRSTTTATTADAMDPYAFAVRSADFYRWDSGVDPHCASVPSAEPVKEAEDVIVGDMVDIPWSTLSGGPMSAESVLTELSPTQGATAPKARRLIANQLQVRELWKMYRAIASSPALAGTINARAVVRFRTTTWAERWVAVGVECRIVQTDDHVCHAFNGPMFQTLVRFLPADVRSSIERIDKSCARLM